MKNKYNRWKEGEKDLELLGIDDIEDEEDKKNAEKNKIGENLQFDSFIADFTVHQPELAFVIFKVFEGSSGSEKYAQFAIPVACIKKGFRTVELMDSELNVIPGAMLFTHISVENLT